jgi:hypothetical protein
MPASASQSAAGEVLVAVMSLGDPGISSRRSYGPEPPASTRFDGSDSRITRLMYGYGEPIALETAAVTLTVVRALAAIAS